METKILDSIISFSGKYSHIGVKYGKQSGHNICLDFGSVALGSMIEKTMELINYTPVSAVVVVRISADTWLPYDKPPGLCVLMCIYSSNSVSRLFVCTIYKSLKVRIASYSYINWSFSVCNWTWGKPFLWPDIFQIKIFCTMPKFFQVFSKIASLYYKASWRLFKASSRELEGDPGKG